MNSEQTNKTEIVFGSSVFVGIAFLGGCFTGNWIPFFISLGIAIIVS